MPHHASRSFVVLFFLCSAFPAAAQTFPEIRITISKGQHARLKAKDERVVFKDCTFTFNGDTVATEEVHSRGKTSLTFERKSLSVDLAKNYGVSLDSGSRDIRKFDLLNLVMDKSLWRNRWCFLALSGVDIFPLENAYCSLWINGEVQGIYLLVEKPNHYSTFIKCPYMLRRGVHQAIDNEYSNASKAERVKYKKQYNDLYKDIAKYKEKDLYDRLVTKLDIDHYFRWLAFNYLIMNGDYDDEVFLYIQPESGLYDVLPWDYDDILALAPHEGYESRNAVQGFRNKLIFSSENPLDRAIAGNDYLYSQYLDSFKKLLNELTPERLSVISDQVLNELRQISRNQEIAQASLHLDKEPFDFQVAEKNIRDALSFLINRRNRLVSQISNP